MLGETSELATNGKNESAGNRDEQLVAGERDSAFLSLLVRRWSRATPPPPKFERYPENLNISL